jgi:hypothetical protein
MTESLAWLRAPEAEYALGDLLCGLIRDIRRILGQPELGSTAQLGAITDAVEQLAPGPGPEADAARTAATVMGLLTRSTGPATLLLEQLAGERIRIELAGRADRQLTAAECQDLRLPPGSSAHYRAGVLRTASSGLLAAEVTSTVVGSRIPPAARRALAIPEPGEPAPPLTGLPLGKGLAQLGVQRETLGARLTRPAGDGPGRRPSVETCARLWLADIPVALATERVTGEFLELAARRAPVAARALSQSRR